MKNNKIEWEDKPYADLVKHIIENYHDVLEKLMPHLSKATAVILRVHGQDHKELSKVHRLFHMIQINMTQHIIKQKVAIFPLIKIYSKRPSEDLLKKITYAIENYKAEKDDTKDLLIALRDATDNYTTPRDGCATYEQTYEMLKEMDDNIMSHLQLEEEVLFCRLKEESR